jgi:hypothetical protein
MSQNPTTGKNRVDELARSAQEIVAAAVIERLKQQEAYWRAYQAIHNSLAERADETAALIAAGDVLFAYIKENCGGQS